MAVMESRKRIVEKSFGKVARRESVCVLKVWSKKSCPVSFGLDGCEVRIERSSRVEGERERERERKREEGGLNAKFAQGIVTSLECTAT